jgi:hypothetical protein
MQKWKRCKILSLHPSFPYLLYRIAASDHPRFTVDIAGLQSFGSTVESFVHVILSIHCTHNGVVSG